MGCEGDEGKCTLFGVLFVTSKACWVITMAFGWTFFAVTPHKNQLVYAAVIASSIPAYTVVLYFFYICAYTDCKNWFCTQSVLRCLLGIEMVAGVIEFVSGILFIAAGATLNNPYGVSADVFGIIAGVTNVLPVLLPCL